MTASELEKHILLGEIERLTKELFSVGGNRKRQPLSETCLAAKDIDCRYASKLAFMLECMVIDSHGHWNAACELLDEYKAAWERINPSPPIFMGESVVRKKREVGSE